MANEEVKRQHYVPRTYLKHFAEPRRDNFFIKVLPITDQKEERIFETSVANVCRENDLYTLTGATPEERMLIERFYSENLERQYDEIYQLLTDPNKTKLSGEERELIISTVVTMLYRTTKALNLFNKFMDRVLEHIFYLCQQTGKDYYMFEGQQISIKGKTLEDLQKENRTKHRPVQALTQLHVALKLITLRSANDGIYVSKLSDEKNEFITSDNPVTYFHIKGGHIAPFDQENVLKLPLDSKHLLFLMPYADKESKHLIIRHNVSGTIGVSQKLTSNSQQAKNADRFLLGTESGLKSYLATKEALEKPLSKEEAEKFKSFQDLLNELTKRGIS